MKSLLLLIGLLGCLSALEVVQPIHFLSFSNIQTWYIDQLNELRNKGTHPHTEELVETKVEHEKQTLKEVVNFAQTNSKTLHTKSANKHRHHKIPAYTKHHIPSFLQMTQVVEVEMVLVEEQAEVNPVDSTENTVLTQEKVEVEEQVQEEPIVET